MLQLNKRTIKAAELLSKLTREEWAKAVGVTPGSYRNKIAGSKNFTLNQILIMQDLSGLPIQNFFEPINPKTGIVENE